MTISYSGNFCNLLFRWKGSIYRSVWKELLYFLLFYYIIRILYNFILPLIDDSNQTLQLRHKFESLSLMFDEYTRLIPLTFLLGFYVSTVVGRWWKQFEAIGWPEDALSVLCAVIPKDDEQSQRRRHAIARWMNLTALLSYRDISSEVRRRFPTVKHFVDAGIMTEREYEKLESLQSKNTRWLVPLQWVQKVIMDEVRDNSPLPALVNNFLQELKLYRSSFRRLFCYDWVCIPLVYTQVAALATYGYFAFCLLGRQYLDTTSKHKSYEIDIYVPIFTIMQFVFFVGWFKVGQDLMRPFGMDDDDIELNYLIDRNLQISFALVHEVHRDSADIDDDLYWIRRNEPVQSLPHTALSANIPNHPPKLHSYIYVKTDQTEDLTTNNDIDKNDSLTSRWWQFRKKRYIANFLQQIIFILDMSIGNTLIEDDKYELTTIWLYV